jgi:hypothetical protein
VQTRLVSILGAAAIVVAVLATVLATAAPNAHAACSTAPYVPLIVTDQPDYPPGETVHIDGCGFQNYVGQDLPIRIIDPVGGVVVDTVLILSGGTFSYDHELPLDAEQGWYVVKVLDLEGVTLATTTFSDAAIHFSQQRGRR